MKNEARNKNNKKATQQENRKKKKEIDQKQQTHTFIYENNTQKKKMKTQTPNKKFLERNILLNYIIGGLMWGRFYIPVLALFYIANQVPLKQFSIIMSAFLLTTIIFEVPSGVIADLLGYKKTLIIARTLYIIEILIISFSHGFWPFLIGKIISGIGVSLSSGTNQAFLFNTLKRLKRTKEHKKISGNAFAIMMFSQAIFFVFGAFLFKINPKLPAYASIPTLGTGLLLSFLLVEPYNNKISMTFKNSMKHLGEGLRLFKKNKYLIYLLIFSLGISVFHSIGLSMSSEYLKQISIPIAIIGFISFIFSALMAISSKKANALEKKLGEKKSFIIIQITALISVFGMMLMIPYYGLLLYLPLSFVVGFSSILINHYMNEHVTTKHRATMLSIKNLTNSIGPAIMFPVFGWISEQWGMGTGWFVIGGIVLLGVVASATYRKVKKITL